MFPEMYRDDRRVYPSEEGDSEYWLTRSPLERLARLEEIRREIILKRYGCIPPMECVAFIKTKSGRALRHVKRK
jgi:hypothetical protein